MAAFTVTARDRDELRETFAPLTDESERIMTGKPYEERDPSYPPLHTGHHQQPAAARTTSAWSCRWARRCSTTGSGWPTGSRSSSSRCRSWPTTGSTPSAPTATCCSPSTATTRTSTCSRCASSCGPPGRSLALHWMLEGYNRRVEAEPGEAGVRNLMGFVDGTANLDPRPMTP